MLAYWTKKEALFHSVSSLRWISCPGPFHFGFWPQEAKKPSRATRGSYERNKFCILDRTKHNFKNFGILHFITPK
jgi:hypothetical protein